MRSRVRVDSIANVYDNSLITQHSYAEPKKDFLPACSWLIVQLVCFWNLEKSTAIRLPSTVINVRCFWCDFTCPLHRELSANRSVDPLFVIIIGKLAKLVFKIESVPK